MNRRSKLIWMALGCLWAVHAHAGLDCAADGFNDLTPSAYAKSYFAQCAEPHAAAKWKEWQLNPLPKSEESKAPARERFRAVQLWQELSTVFAALQGAGMQSATDKVILGFSERARLTAETISADAQKHVAPGNALYRSDNWVTKGLVLPRPFLVQPANTVLNAIYDLPAALDEDCQVANSSRCTDSIKKSKSLMEHWLLAHELGRLIGKADIALVAQQVQKDNEDWQTYLYEGKPMLPLDIGLTDFFEGKAYGQLPEFADGRAAPPKRQWFLLHPSIGMEYVSSATDGQQLKPVLHLELVGVNWWRTTDRPFGNTPLLKYFSGISLTASYADRAGVKDAGVGALLTFDNSMSVSISKYGSKPALSVSWSFLKADKSVDGSAESFKRKLIDSLPKEVTASK